MTDKPIQRKFTVLEGGKGVARKTDTVQRADTVMSAQEARAIVSDPGVTLEMITQDVFDALMRDEIQEQEEAQLDQGESSLLDDSIIEEIGMRTIDQIVNHLMAADNPAKEDARAYLESRYKIFKNRFVSKI